MVKAVILGLIAASLSTAWPTDVHAATVTAATCSLTDVAAAVGRASNGDTVQIAAGRCSWTSTLSISKGISLIGAGIDQTIIEDNVPRTSPSFGIVIDVSTARGADWRLSGFTVTYGSVAEIGGQGAIRLGGASHAFRIDHVKLDNTVHYHLISTYGDLWGVIDHCQFNTSRNSVGIHIRHDQWGGVGAYGDNSWATPTNLGSEQFIFVEDNIGTSIGAVQDLIDGTHGSRYVARYNTTVNMPIGGGHGTDSGGRFRGVRAFEIYNNTMSTTSLFGVASYLRSGTGVIYNNKLTNFQYAVTGQNFRDIDAFAPWGAADGSSRFDVNTGVIYASGTHTGANGVALILSDSTKAWSSSQWVGYSVRNITQGWGTAVASNTATSIAAYQSNYGQTRTWNTGDAYQILKSTAALDQVGRGAGNLVSGDAPTPAAWPNQAAEPVYVWNNAGYLLTEASGRWNSVQGGRDIIVAPKDYQSFPYPHPLVSGSAVPVSGSTAPSTAPVPPPSNLTVK